MEKQPTKWMRRGLATSVVAAVVAAAALGVVTMTDSSTQNDSTSDKAPPIPQTPAGDHLRWTLDQLNGGAGDLQAADVSARFSPAFLELTPAPQILELLQQSAAERGPFTFIAFAQPPTPTMVVALVSTAGERAAVRIATEATGAHRITSMELGDPPPTMPPGPDTGSVDIGGRQIFLRCTGQGSPTVVLEGGTTADWLPIHDAVAQVTRVCSYDRANGPWSRSDPAPMPRSGRDVVDDLHAVLAAAKVPGPYLLAGHSNGGLFAQLFARLHGDEVAGLVLIDSVHVDYQDRRLALINSLPAPGQPAGAQALPRPQFIDPEAQILLDETLAEVRAAIATTPLPAMPLRVLTHGKPAPADFPPGSPEAADATLWLQLQTELTGLVPGARQVVAKDSGHDIPSEDPEVVVGAITEVVRAARGGTS